VTPDGRRVRPADDRRGSRLPAGLPVVGVLVVLAIVALAACGVAGTSGGAGGSPSVVPSVGSPRSSGSLVSPIVGVPIHLDTQGFTQVKAFTLRMDDGSEATFAMGPLENATQFPPNHIAEHLAGSTKVKVFFRDEGGTPTAYRIEDVLTP
jgi:hypothetical protein